MATTHGPVSHHEHIATEHELTANRSELRNEITTRVVLRPIAVEAPRLARREFATYAVNFVRGVHFKDGARSVDQMTPEGKQLLLTLVNAVAQAQKLKQVGPPLEKRRPTAAERNRPPLDEELAFKGVMIEETLMGAGTHSDVAVGYRFWVLLRKPDAAPAGGACGGRWSRPGCRGCAPSTWRGRGGRGTDARRTSRGASGGRTSRGSRARGSGTRSRAPCGSAERGPGAPVCRVALHPSKNGRRPPCEPPAAIRDADRTAR